MRVRNNPARKTPRTRTSARRRSSIRREQSDPASDSLLQIFAELKPRHRNLLGVGVGRRRRKGTLEAEWVVKLIVDAKPAKGRRLPRGLRALPREVAVWGSILGRRVAMMIPTDVEAAERFRMTTYGIGKGMASALAAWVNPQGVQRIGVMTCAHCLPTSGPVKIRVGNGVAIGKVVARSDINTTGLDVGLAELPADQSDILDVAPHGLPIASPQHVIDIMGLSATDPLSVPVQFWNGYSPPDITGVAFYSQYPVVSGPGMTITYRNVVEVNAVASTFRPGQSGTAWAAGRDAADAVVVAIQSAMNPSGSRCLGTHFGVAIEWLRSMPQFRNLTPMWSLSDLP